MKKQTLLIGTAVVLVVGFVLASNWYRGAETERVETIADENTEVLAPDYAMSLGSEDARVTLVEFFDPACETCAVFQLEMSSLKLEAPPNVAHRLVVLAVFQLLMFTLRFVDP